MRNILLSAATVLLAGTTLVGSAHSAELPKGAVHNIVLVHGAFVDQTSWQPVADILTKKGYNVTLVENPLTSLTADVEATKQALAKQDGRTVLVGHSWGGVVITEAGDDPKVSALVYVCAFAPGGPLDVLPARLRDGLLCCTRTLTRPLVQPPFAARQGARDTRSAAGH